MPHIVAPEVAPRNSAFASCSRVLDFRYETGIVLGLYILEPFCTLCKSLRFRVECRRPMEDLVVVYLDDGRKISFRRVSEDEIHGKRTR